MAKPEAITLPADCPVFRAINKRPVKNDCAHCPFQRNCPEDILNDAMSKIMVGIGRYLDAHHTSKK